jgi:hypothetical protein
VIEHGKLSLGQIMRQNALEGRARQLMDDANLSEDRKQR